MTRYPRVYICVTCGREAAVRYHFNDDKSRSWYACSDACAVAYQIKDAREKGESHGGT